MGDINVKVIAERLGKSLESATDAAISEIEVAIQNLAHSAHAAIIAKVQASNMGDKNKAEYLKGLSFESLGNNNYLISLDGNWPNQLEEGVSAYSLKEKLLASKSTVSQGSRAGEPWVRVSKAGKKYAAVPFQRHPSNGPAKGDLGLDLKHIYALNREGNRQPITKTFSDAFGNPIAGKVATADHRVGGDDLPPNLVGLTKYQHVSNEGTVSSFYATFRMIHEDSSGWNHPGMPGREFFDIVEHELDSEVENIIKTILG